MLGRVRATGSPSLFRAVFSQGECGEIRSFADSIPWEKRNRRRLQNYALDTFLVGSLTCSVITNFDSQHLNISPLTNIPLSTSGSEVLAAINTHGKT